MEPSAIRRFFENLHQKPLPIWMWPFLPVCWIYQIAVQIRLSLYSNGMLKPFKVSVPVISVGNITTGGTGKTPVVIAFAKHLTQTLHKRVVVLSRGYGARKPQDYARATSPDFGDEAFLIQERVSDAVVIVGRNRLENAKKAIEEFKPDVIVLDDGYQYIKLHRDINLALVDASVGFGNGYALPLGMLREPLSQLRRASAVAFTKQTNSTKLSLLTKQVQSKTKPGTVTLPPIHWPFEAAGIFSPNKPDVLVPLSEFTNRSIVAFCGIARPDSFFESLQNVGIQVPDEQCIFFSDHHDYVIEDIQNMQQRFPNSAMITTEKDWSKLQAVIPKDQWKTVFCLRIEPNIQAHHFDAILKPIFPEKI